MIENPIDENIILIGSIKMVIYGIEQTDYHETMDSVKTAVIFAVLLIAVACVFAIYVCAMRLKKERDVKKEVSIIANAKRKIKEKSQETMITEEAIEHMAMDSWRLAVICPLTKRVMHDPVFLCDGYTYEREVIEEWLKTNNASPITNQTLANKSLVPNLVLCNFIHKNLLAEIK